MNHPQQQIMVTITPEGDIRIDAKGYTGSTCEEATAFLETALGNVKHREQTRDRYRRSPHIISNQQEVQS
tara:strand:- start:5462 stop:5671 length:210 start_codon:yes stop_codon:yes gene_type:complete